MPLRRIPVTSADVFQCLAPNTKKVLKIIYIFFRDECSQNIRSTVVRAVWEFIILRGGLGDDLHHHYERR